MECQRKKLQKMCSDQLLEDFQYKINRKQRTTKEAIRIAFRRFYNFRTGFFLGRCLYFSEESSACEMNCFIKVVCELF